LGAVSAAQFGSEGPPQLHRGIAKSKTIPMADFVARPIAHASSKMQTTAQLHDTPRARKRDG
jgi:hypothetical protein